MATYSPNVSDSGAIRPSYEEDEIELRPLFAILLKWWQEILLVTIVAAVVGSAVNFYQNLQVPPTYQASAQVAIARIVTKVNLDDSFQTEVNRVGTSNQDSNARRNSLLGLVKNGTIAAAVIDELGPLIDEKNPVKLVRSIEADFAGADTSDLIEITAEAETAKMAAAIANAWAKHYVEHINTLYGEMPIEMVNLVEVEVEKAKTLRQETQQAYEAFLGQNDIQTISREMEETQLLIDSLRQSRKSGLEQTVTQTLAYRNQVIISYLDTLQQNRLLAFTSEQEANRQLVQSLIQAISSNRQLAFATEQKARVQLFTQYADRELENRLLAMQQEQNAKTEIFRAYSDADLKAKLAVFNEQVNGKVQSMINAHANKERAQQLLDQAIALQKQITQAGEAGARTNSLPLLLLKLEVYALTGADNLTAATPSGNVQLDLAAANTLETDLENQSTDIAVLISTLTERINELETRIETESLALFNNEGYQLLGQSRPEDDELYAAMQKQYLTLFDVDTLAQTEGTLGDESVLSQAILTQYDELFGLGALTAASQMMTGTTPIYLALEAQYPALFTVGDLTQLGDALVNGSALDVATQEKIAELLQPPASLAQYLTATDSGERPLVELEQKFSTLKARLESQEAQRDLLVQARDMARDAYITLNSKQLELTLQRTAANREVRLAATANLPDRPNDGESWIFAGVIFAVAGFLSAIVIALLGSYFKKEPFLSRLRPPQVSVAGRLRP